MLKKLMSCILVVALLCGCTITSFGMYEEISESVSSEEMKTFLISHDYPSDYLDSLILPQLENLYHLAVEKNAYFYSRSTSCSGATSQNGDGTVVPTGNIPSDELYLSVTMSYTPISYNGATYYGEMFMTVDYEWKELPMIRGIDAITVNWDSSLLVYGGDDSFTAYDYMENPYNNNWEVWKKWDKPKATNQGGLGIDTYIDSGANINSEWVSAAGLKGSVHFSLLPKTSLSMKINPESVTAVSADYTHNKNPLGFGLSFAFYGVSVSVAPGVLQDSISATDTIRYTYVK